MKNTLIIFSSSQYPLPVLDAILNSKEFAIGLIITRPDRPVGRKQILTPNPVKLWANKKGIDVITPETFEGKNEAGLINKISALNPDLGLVAHFGLKIPHIIYVIPQKQTLNIHFSLLPKYRGGAPLEYTIINGDKETGISILKLTEKFDEGDIVYQEKIPLKGDETVDSLYKSLFHRTTEIIPDTLKKYINGEIKPFPQSGTPVLALKKDLGNGRIDWNKTPEELEHFIRALNPNPGTWTIVNLSNKQEAISNKLAENYRRLKIQKSHLENGKLILDEVQLEGKNPIRYEEYKKYYGEIGTR